MRKLRWIWGALTTMLAIPMMLSGRSAVRLKGLEHSPAAWLRLGVLYGVQRKKKLSDDALRRPTGCIN